MKKNEIKQLYYFYKNLDDIKIIYSKIIDSRKEAMKEFTSIGRGTTTTVWDTSTLLMGPPSVPPSSWMEFETLVCKVLEEGNSVKDNLFACYLKIA